MAPKPTPWDRLIAGIDAHDDDASPVVELGIPMRDGVELAADVYLPLERPAPAIVQLTPYDKGNATLSFVQEARFYQEHGYTCVVVDVRGRGKSEGEWRAFVGDGRDGHDVVEWAAAQDWCDGAVGMTGISYMGWVQWATAAERPPHLAAMVSTSAAGRWQEEIPYTWGVLQLYFAWWTYLVRRRITESLELTEDWYDILSRIPVSAIGEFINPSGRTWRDVTSRETLDDFWRALRLDDRYVGIDVPCLHVTGWYDLEDLLGAFHHYESMMARSPAASSQRLLVGPWSHVKCRTPHSSCGGVEFGASAALDMDDLHLRWFDHWLKGRKNGVGELPPVTIFEPGTNQWRACGAWPLGSQTLTLHFARADGVGALSPAAPAEGGSREYVYDPRDPTPTQVDVGRYPLADPPLDQTEVERRPDVLTCTGTPLAEKTVVSGWCTVELDVTVDTDDTDFHVKLTDVAPDDTSTRVTQGCLRASFGQSLSSPAALRPGERNRFTVQLWPTHHAFLPGHRIRVSVTGSDFPWFARNMNRFEPIATATDPRPARVRIHHGPDAASRVTLSIE